MCVCMYVELFGYQQTNAVLEISLYSVIPHSNTHTGLALNMKFFFSMHLFHELQYFTGYIVLGSVGLSVSLFLCRVTQIVQYTL